MKDVLLTLRFAKIFLILAMVRLSQFQGEPCQCFNIYLVINDSRAIMKEQIFYK